jgi:hypothetical protein
MSNSDQLPSISRAEGVDDLTSSELSRVPGGTADPSSSKWNPAQMFQSQGNLEGKTPGALLTEKRL